MLFFFFFFFNDTATTEIYTLSLHDALPISCGGSACGLHWRDGREAGAGAAKSRPTHHRSPIRRRWRRALSGEKRSEEHTSELQSHLNLVCRLLLEKKKTNYHLRADQKTLCD